MTRATGESQGKSCTGQTLVEFSVVTFLTIMMFLFVIETGRMVLVYTAVANAAEEGVRYAVVHGTSRANGVGQTNASGPSPSQGNAQILTIVNNFAATAPLTASLLVVTVAYTGSYTPLNSPGNTVSVSVVYPYNPLVTYFPATLRLGSISQGIILF